jgi:hypothetical protein
MIGATHSFFKFSFFLPKDFAAFIVVGLLLPHLGCFDVRRFMVGFGVGVHGGRYSSERHRLHMIDGCLAYIIFSSHGCGKEHT